MQVRDLIEQLQKFDPRSSVEFDIKSRLLTATCPGCDEYKKFRIEHNCTDCNVTRGPDSAVITLSF